MHTEEITYEADGVSCIGHLAVPDGSETRPAILVSHEGGGLTEHARGMADRLASELGYVAFALDYFGGGKPLPRNEANSRLGGLIQSQERTRALAHAGLAVLLSEPRADAGRVGAIGFCFGGTMSLELGRSGADIKAIVGFHSGLGNATPADAANITGKVLVCIGAEDPIIPPSQRAAFEEEMRAGAVDWQMHLYGGAAHSFTNPAADGSIMPAIKYHEPSARRSWKAMVDLFAEVF